MGSAMTQVWRLRTSVRRPARLRGLAFHRSSVYHKYNIYKDAGSVRVQTLIVIPGENRTISCGSREGDLGGAAAWVPESGRRFRPPSSKPRMLQLLGPLSLARLRAARPGMTRLWALPSHFGNSKAS